MEGFMYYIMTTLKRKLWTPQDLLDDYAKAIHPEVLGSDLKYIIKIKMTK